MGGNSDWTVVALAPFLAWANGPSVSTDQFVARTGVFSLALVTAVGLRVGKRMRRQQKTVETERHDLSPINGPR